MIGKKGQLSRVKSKDKSRFQMNMYTEISTGENREEALKNRYNSKIIYSRLGCR